MLSHVFFMGVLNLMALNAMCLKTENFLWYTLICLYMT